jgi:hypothetical protein
MTFVSGGVQYDLELQHLIRHSIISSFSLNTLSIYLAIQLLANSIGPYHSDLFKSTWTSSDMVRIYRTQYIDRV